GQRKQDLRHWLARVRPMVRNSREGPFVFPGDSSSTDGFMRQSWGDLESRVSRDQSWTRAGVALFACSAAFAAPALINGAPFLYFDSADYIYIPETALQKLTP